MDPVDRFGTESAFYHGFGDDELVEESSLLMWPPPNLDVSKSSIAGDRVSEALDGYRVAFADHIEASLALYGQHLPTENDSLEEIREKRSQLKDALYAQRLRADGALGREYGDLLEAAETITPDDLHHAHLALAKQDLTNSTYVMARGRALALIAAYERRAGLLEEKAQLTEEIDSTWWPQLVKRFRRWRIERLLKPTTREEDLAKLKQHIGEYRRSLPEIELRPGSYEEMLEALQQWLDRPDYPLHIENDVYTLKEKIEKVIEIEAELGARPSPATLEMFGKEIVADLQGPAYLVSIKTAKAMQARLNKQLKWGIEAIDEGLLSHANWTTVHRVAIKENIEGETYVTSTVTEPLFEEMIPSGLRTARPERPVNAWKETHTVKGVSVAAYRIASLMSDAAAVHAIVAMENPERLHLNALLTPVGRFTLDSARLTAEKEHFRAIEGGPREIIRTNVPVNLLGRTGYLRSNRTNQRGLEQYDNHPLKTEIGQLWNGLKEPAHQFEIPAKLSLLDHLQGITELFHCISTKDRSSEKAVAAHDEIDEHYTAPRVAEFDEVQERHRRAVNRRHGGRLALVNPQRNTSFAGTKMKLWKGLIWYRAGFDREYVLLHVYGYDKPGERLRILTGADELGPIRAAEIERKANALGENQKGLGRLLRQIAEEKAHSFKPFARVKT